MTSKSIPKPTKTAVRQAIKKSKASQKEKNNRSTADQLKLTNLKEKNKSKEQSAKGTTRRRSPRSKSSPPESTNEINKEEVNDPLGVLDSKSYMALKREEYQLRKDAARFNHDQKKGFSI